MIYVTVKFIPKKIFFFETVAIAPLKNCSELILNEKLKIM